MWRYSLKIITDCIDQTFDYKGFNNAINGEVTVWDNWRKSVNQMVESIKENQGLYSKYITILEIIIYEKKYESWLVKFIDRLIDCIAVLVSILGILVSGFITSQNLLGGFWTSLSQKDLVSWSEIIDNLKETYSNIWVFSGQVAFGCLLFFLFIYLMDIIFRVIDIKLKRDWDIKRTFYLYLYNEIKIRE